jgi:hypothetical protein
MLVCAQDICRKYDIPTAAYDKFTDPDKAKVRLCVNPLKWFRVCVCVCGQVLAKVGRSP